MKLIEEFTGKKHLVTVWFEDVKGQAKYTVIPKTKNTDYPYPIARKIKSFTSREAAEHYTKSL